MIDCPKCKSPMQRVTVDTIEVDRCVNCQGLWFDSLEHQHLRQVSGAEAIDIGTPASRPKSSPPPATIDCPVCKTRMILMTDPRQPHLRFESCTVCHGAFFDAGEFRDYKQETLTEWLRTLLPRRS